MRITESFIDAIYLCLVGAAIDFRRFVIEYILLLLFYFFSKSAWEKVRSVEMQIVRKYENYYSASKRLMRDLYTLCFSATIFSSRWKIDFILHTFVRRYLCALCASHTNSRRNIYRTYAFTRKSRSADEPTLTQCKMKNKFMKNETIFLHSLTSRVSARLFHYIFAQCSDS